MGPGLKAVDVVGPKDSTDRGIYSTGLRISSIEFLFNYFKNLSISDKSPSSHLMYIIFHGDPTTSWPPHRKICGVVTPDPQD